MKNYLVPHKGNKYNPHIFKTKNLIFILIFAIIVTLVSYLGSFALRNSGLLASIQSAFLVDLANKDRVEESVAVLTVNPLLVEAAQRKANDMVSNSYFAHVSPAGLTPWKWFRDVKYDYLYAGENLAVNFTESVDVHKAWIASPTHKKNIMDKRFTEIGIATADGFYKGRKATFVVQMFGRPRSNSLTSNVLASTPVTVPLQVSGPSASQGTSPSKEVSKVFGAEDSQEENTFISETSAVERVAVSPLSLGRYIILGLILVLVLALVLRFVVEYKRHHRVQVLTLVFIIVLLTALVYVQKNILFETEISNEAIAEG